MAISRRRLITFYLLTAALTVAVVVLVINRGRTEQALQLKLLRQISQVVLKRIGNPHISRNDPTLANSLVYFVAEGLIY